MAMTEEAQGCVGLGVRRCRRLLGVMTFDLDPRRWRVGGGKMVRFYSQTLEGLFQAEAQEYEQKPKGLSDGARTGTGSHRTEAGVGGHGPLDAE